MIALLMTVASFALGAITGPTSVCVGSSITLSDSSTGGTWFTSSSAIATIGSTTGVVTGMTAGTVTISYYLAGLVTTIITVKPAPAAISGTFSACVGNTSTLTDATGGGTWMSSNTSIATAASTTGVVTGVAPGVANIYYLLTNGCGASHTFTVTPGAGTITGPTTVCVGSTITLTDTTSGGTWSCSGTSIATVGSTTGVVTGIGAGTVNIYYLVGSCGAYRTLTVTAGGSITGASSLCVGTTTTLTGSGSGTWSSTNSSIATVGSTGIVSGISAGVVTISFTGTGCSATKTMTVTAGATSISGASSLCVGATTTLTDSTSGGSWVSSNTSIATVTSGGVVTGVSGGVVNITYALSSGCMAIKTLTITRVATISGPSSVCVGATITLTDSTSGGTWTCSGSSIATVGSTTGVVTGVGAGTVNIYYVVGGCGAYRTVTVTTGGGSISGASTLCVGATTTLTSGTGGTWSSSNTGIATVSSAGVVTGISGGVVTIDYTSGGCSASKTMTVTGVSAISGPSSLCVGSTITLTDSTSGGTWTCSGSSIATVGSTTGVVTGVGAGVVNIYYVVGGCGAYRTVTVTTSGTISGASTVCVGNTITLTSGTGGTWSSSNSSIASVSSGGVVTGVAAGVATISYTSGTCSATRTVTVTTGAGAISGPSTVCAGSSITLTDATSGGVWVSSAIGVATVGSTTGVVTGVTAGVVNIYYTIGSCGAYKTVTVTSTAAISGASSVCQGAYITLTDATAGGTWISSDTTKATVSSAGVVIGVGAGVVNIYYVAGGCGAYKTVTVMPAPAAIGGPSTVCQGQTITLTDATGGGVWTSGTVTVATVVSSTGVVTGIAAGLTSNITYTLSSGCKAVKTVSVVAAQPISGAASVCMGATTTYTNIVAGGSWSSSASGIASVNSSTGVVTGVSAGTATIYYVLASGCATYKVISVSSTGSISGPSTVCQGQSITLTSTGSGSWISSNIYIATVGSTGIVTGIAGGLSATISYYTSGCSATHTVSVVPFAAISGSSTVCAGSSITLTDAVAGGVWLTGGAGIETVDSTTGVVTGVSAGVANIYYTLNGCNAYKTVTVLPTPAAIAGPGNVCAGHTITLTDATSGGSWTSGATTIATVGTSGIVSGLAGTLTANISYTLTNGCRATKTITVYANPVVGGISGMFSLSTGGTTTLSDTTAGGVRSSSNTAIGTVDPSTGVVYGVSAGNIYIIYTVTNAAGCSTSTYRIVTVGPTPPPHSSGLDVNSMNLGIQNIQVTPNPNNGEFVISAAMGSDDQEVTIEVTNLLGQTVYHNVANVKGGNMNEKVILGNTLSNGMYLLVVRSGNQNQVIRFVIEK